MNEFDRHGNIVLYDYWTIQRSTIGFQDDFGNCVPLGVIGYDFYFLGGY